MRPAFGTRPPLVSVVVASVAEPEVLEQTLALLLAQDWPADRLEILVCAPRPSRSARIVDRVGARGPVRVRCVASDAALAAARRNEGVRRAHGELVVFLDADIWVRPDFVRRHVDAHRAHDEPVAVLGLVEQSPRMASDPFVDWFRPFGFGPIAGLGGEAVPFWFHWSMNLSAPRLALLDGDLLFDEHWREDGHDDVEHGYRWARAGYRTIFEPAAWGEHFDPSDLGSACEQQARFGRGLRDLEALVAEPDLLERYGVFSWRSSPRSVARGLARRALFNRVTVPPLRQRLERSTDHRRWAEWAYWKVMVHHAEEAYRATAPRVRPTGIAATSASSRAAAVIHLSPPESEVVIDLRDRLPDDDVLDVVFAM